jgi:hypothetical protein
VDDDSDIIDRSSPQPHAAHSVDPETQPDRCCSIRQEARAQLPTDSERHPSQGWHSPHGSGEDGPQPTPKGSGLERAAAPSNLLLGQAARGEKTQVELLDQQMLGHDELLWMMTGGA